MAPGSCTPLVPGILALLLLQNCLCTAPTQLTTLLLQAPTLANSPSQGTHTLSYDFTINPKPTPGQPWCEVHGLVDEKPFFSYDCGTDEVKTMRFLGRQVRATQVWEEQKEALRDMGNFLKQQLADIKAENDTTKDPFTLNGRMSCQKKPSGCTSGFWKFGFSGQMSLHFNSNSRKWREMHPGSRWLIEKWENDRHMTSFLHRTSLGDCRSWLQKFLVPWKEILEPIEHSTAALEMAEPKAMAFMPSPWALLVILMGSILLGI